MDKCPHCPVAGLDRPCLAQMRRHPRYCELVDPASPHYRPTYVPIILAAKAPPPPIGETDEKARRRAGKPRIPLGTKHPKARDG